MMNIVLLDKKCMPVKGYDNDAGFDLRTRGETIHILPGETIKFPTGVCWEIPLGYAGDIRPRSGNDDNLWVHYGTVDPGYTGEIKIKVTNIGREPIKIEKYQRLAQIVIVKTLNKDLKVVKSLKGSDRGPNGFHSTGKF